MGIEYTRDQVEDMLFERYWEDILWKKYGNQMDWMKDKRVGDE